MIWLALVLAICLVLLGAEVAHARWCDYCQARDVRRSMYACIRAVRREVPSDHPRFWTEVEREYDRINDRRKRRGADYLPKHLTGIPSRQILARAA